MSTYMKLLVCIAISCLVLPTTYSQRGAESKLPPYSLSEMKVVPYSQRTNTFLKEVSDDEEFWNELNLSLFVTVQISGKAGSYSSDRQVEVTAYEGEKLILRRVSPLGVIDEKTGKYYVPVWLYGSFCQPVKIKAKLLGQSESSSINRSFNFHCGE